MKPAGTVTFAEPSVWVLTFGLVLLFVSVTVNITLEFASTLFGPTVTL